MYNLTHKTVIAKLSAKTVDAKSINNLVIRNSITGLSKAVNLYHICLLYEICEKGKLICLFLR